MVTIVGYDNFTLLNYLVKNGIFIFLKPLNNIIERHKHCWWHLMLVVLAYFMRFIDTGLPRSSLLFEPCSYTMYTMSQKKLFHYTFVCNCDKCWPIFTVLSLLYSPINLQQIPCHITHHTLDVSLHYLAKYKKLKFAKFCCIGDKYELIRFWGQKVQVHKKFSSGGIPSDDSSSKTI